MRILYLAMRPAFEFVLRSRKFVVETATNTADASDLLQDYAFDCILICDDAHGATAGRISNLRSNGIKTPILVYVDDGCGDSDQAVQMLDAGADDYLWGSFSDAELAARLRALIRRPNGIVRSTIEVGDMVLDTSEKRITIAGRAVHLTVKEYEMLELMALRQGRVVTRDQFLDHLYQQRDEPEQKIMDVFICKIRRKIGAERIKNVWGRGYMLVATPEVSRTESSRPSIAHDPYNLVETNWSTTPA